MGRPKVESLRLQVTLSGSLYEKIDSYAETMGVSVPEAARHLMLRGLEQVQLLVTSKNSADALRRMTESFDRAMDIEEAGANKPKSQKKSLKKPVSKPLEKPVRGLVTPAQSAKNGTDSENIKDMFA